MSKICAFFGHRDTPVTEELEAKLKQTILSLIEQGVDEFWCCEQGNFDWIARLTMLGLRKIFPEIKIAYVLAYPTFLRSKISADFLDKTYDYIIYPDEAAEGYRKFAIIRRNQYIVKNADIIVCYVKRPNGGAYKAVEQAKKLNKKIINLGY